MARKRNDLSESQYGGMNTLSSLNKRKSTKDTEMK